MADLPLATPSSGAMRGMDLLRWPAARRFLRWRYARLVLQLPIALLALLVIIDGFTGVQLAPRNLATTSVWLHYRGLVVLALITVGNLFCATCPLMLTRGPARFAKRWLPREWRWPAALRSKLLVWGLMLAYFYAYEAFALWASPWLTAWLVVGYFGSAFAIDTLFPAGTFCRYVCPLGNFNFVLASASPTVVSTVNPDVCLSCTEKPCLHGRISDHAELEGRWRGADGSLQGALDGPRKAAFIPRHAIVHDNGSGRFPGCETGLFVPALQSNLDCTLCGNCLRACPYDNVTLRSRPVSHEGIVGAWRHRGMRSALLLGVSLSAWGMLNAFAMVPPYYALAETLATTLGTRAEWLVLALIFLVATALGLGFAFGATLIADRIAGERTTSPWGALERWGMVWVTLGIGFWVAHYLFHFLTGALAIVPVFEHFFALRGVPLEPNWRFAQLVPSRWLFPIGAGVVSLATLVALWQVGRIALRDFGRRGLAAAWWLGLLVLLVGVLQVLLLGLPMEMRGTLLGPLPAATVEHPPTVAVAPAPTPAPPTPPAGPAHLASPAPPCSVDARIAPHDPDLDPARVLLDPSYRLPPGYAPSDLRPVAEAGFAGDHLVRAILIDDLRALREAAEADGVALAIQSAYRSEAYQRNVHAIWVERLGAERAVLVSARAGHSEHQLGTAIDLRSANGPPAWDLDDWAQTPEGGWVAERAAEFGFVISYPAGSKEVSCYDYEPWHLRWVGRATAAAVQDAGLPYRAWLYAHHPPEPAGPP